MRKSFVVFMTTGFVLTTSGFALAATDITPSTYSLSGKDFHEKVQGSNYYNGSELATSTYNGTSSNRYGTWNSPYTLGIDGYNYNDAQDYTTGGEQTQTGGTVTVNIPTASGAIIPFTWPKMTFQSGPHGGYKTSTHRCRECHAVHRAAGKFKLLRSDTRFEACDWCHGTGAGSGFNVQMDNDDQYTEEYNTGHTMGFGVSNGKWKAPDDTFPAFTPNYWMGGFSCFDCHSPHANPQRLLGYDTGGNPIPSIVDTQTGEVFNIGNPGHDMYSSGGDGFAGYNAANLAAGKYIVPALGVALPKPKPYYLAGSWLLIKDPDKEISSRTDTTAPNPIQSWNGSTFVNDSDVTFTVGQEIPDAVTATLNEFDSVRKYPINKVPTDWNTPIGSASLWDQQFGTGMPAANDNYGYNVRNPFCRSFILDEFCTDCHDGNAGLHTIAAPLFSEDRALRDQTQTSSSETTDSGVTGDTTNWKGQYDIAYGHDSNVRH